jgi:hypothetical protein
MTPVSAVHESKMSGNGRAYLLKKKRFPLLEPNFSGLFAYRQIGLFSNKAVRIYLGSHEKRVRVWRRNGRVLKLFLLINNAHIC